MSLAELSEQEIIRRNSLNVEKFGNKCLSGTGI